MVTQNKQPIDTTAAPTPSLTSWFRRPNPGYVPLNQVSFGALEITTPMPVPQMPAATGIRGAGFSDADLFDKLQASAPMQRIFNGARSLTRF